MAKSTKQMSAETGESGGEPVKKKVASRKRVAKKADSPSAGAGKTVAAGKTAAKKTATAKSATGKSATGKSATGKSATGKSATAKSATRQAVAEKTVEKKPAPRKKAATGAAVHRQISSAERRRMIAEAAYLRAESQGFLSDEREDWLSAEAEVDGVLMRTAVIVRD